MCQWSITWFKSSGSAVLDLDSDLSALPMHVWLNLDPHQRLKTTDPDSIRHEYYKKRQRWFHSGQKTCEFSHGCTQNFFFVFFSEETTCPANSLSVILVWIQVWLIVFFTGEVQENIFIYMHEAHVCTYLYVSLCVCVFSQNLIFKFAQFWTSSVPHKYIHTSRPWNCIQFTYVHYYYIELNLGKN